MGVLDLTHPDQTFAIELCGLCAGHATSTYLREVDWQVPSGQRMGLVGPNGAGKTTLFLTLAGVLVPKSGKARVSGMDLTDQVSRRKVAGVLGLVMQDPDDQLLETSVWDDIALGPTCQGLSPSEVQSRVESAIRATGLEPHADRVPQRLSVGEKKRVALAGVLARRPQIILLDEPTAGLDPRGRRDLIQLLKGLSATLVIATHDLELVLDLCQQATLMDGGRLVKKAEPATLLADATLMESHGLEVPWPLRHG